jgi:PAS domain S-box-containing protein
MPNEVLEQLLELVPDATVAVRRDGTIVRANAQAETLFGYEPGELIGQPLERLVPNRLAAGHAAKRTGYFAETRARPMGSGLELYAKRKNGSEFPADISLSQIELDGVELATAAVRDISERLRAERRREQLELDLEREKAARERQALEVELGQLRRAESLGQLAGGIAHDFNNLLGVILNYSQLAADALDPEASARADVEQIEHAAERASALTRQLLVFSRGEVPHREVVDVAAVLRGSEKLLRRVLGGKAVLEARVDDELWPIEADPAQLEQVIVNLAVNARDAMPDGGRLVIAARNIALDDTALAGRGELAPGPYTRVTVADSGTGMSGEVIGQAFEPFFTTKPRGVGTGLGLSTVYGIVTKLGGAIRIYSEPGFGTTVKIDLPAITVPASTSVTDLARQVAGGGRESVLLVEDEDALRRVTERILSEAGYRVISATDGLDALRLAGAREPVDLLMTDVVMPEMMGPELARRLHELSPELHVLYTSGFVPQIAETHALLDRSQTLLEKPFTSAELLTAVRGAIDRPAVFV